MNPSISLSLFVYPSTFPFHLTHALPCRSHFIAHPPIIVLYHLPIGGWPGANHRAGCLHHHYWGVAADHPQRRLLVPTGQQLHLHCGYVRVAVVTVVARLMKGCVSVLLTSLGLLFNVLLMTHPSILAPPSFFLHLTSPHLTPLHHPPSTTSSAHHSPAGRIRGHGAHRVHPHHPHRGGISAEVGAKPWTWLRR